MTQRVKIPKVQSKAKSKIKQPKSFRAVFLNDEHTTMQFIVEVLIDVFRKSAEETEQIMMTEHREGRGIAGTYTCEICAQTASLTISHI